MGRDAEPAPHENSEFARDEELHAAFPGVEYVDGGPGIARRIAYLTREQPWPASSSEGLMVFTGAGRIPSLSALAQFGIGEIRTI